MNWWKLNNNRKKTTRDTTKEVLNIKMIAQVHRSLNFSYCVELPSLLLLTFLKYSWDLPLALHCVVSRYIVCECSIENTVHFMPPNSLQPKNSKIVPDRPTAHIEDRPVPSSPMAFLPLSWFPLASFSRCAPLPPPTFIENNNIYANIFSWCTKILSRHQLLLWFRPTTAWAEQRSSLW